MAQPIRFPATVEQVTHHTPDVATYRLRADKRLPRFIPGQFIHLTLEPFDPASFWPESRVFSVANAVADRRTVELTISRQGAYTNKILDQLSEGDRIWAKGPYGDFTIDANLGYSRAVLIAGGTGITPFCAFMDAALSQGRCPSSTPPSTTALKPRTCSSIAHSPIVVSQRYPASRPITTPSRRRRVRRQHPPRPHRPRRDHARLHRA